MNQISLKLAGYLSYKRQFFCRASILTLFTALGYLLAATRIFGNSRDYYNYDIFFDLVRREGLNTLKESRFEPGFSALTIILEQLLSTNAIVYGWFVFFAMLLKGWAISTYSSNQRIFLIVALFYFSRYFPLHELTQLRVACAIALVMVGAILIWRDDLLLGTLVCASALSFHMSAAAVIPALFLPSSKRWQVTIIAISIFILTLTLSGLITGYLGNVIQIIANYQTVGFSNTAPNPFAIQLLIDWSVLITSLIKWKDLSSLMKRIILLELIGMAVYYGGLEFGVIAHRIREFYSVFWALFLANGLQYRPTKLLSYYFAFISIFFYTYVFFISGSFFS